MGGSVSLIDGHIDEVLKPCPFCGAPMNGKNHLFGWHREDCFLVLLEEPPFIEDMTDEEFTTALAEAWNRRADT